ncbi:MAG: hypothetical protein N3A64_00300, partial [Desulfobacterota bacterium]|nr:hypothetical protein [Thermodesulfobacteriota bacterium]
MTFTKVKCLIIHPMDPLGNKIGGIETLIKNFIKYTPKDFDIEFVGISSDKRRQIGKWHHAELCGKEFNFLPILYIENENIRPTIPLSIKFTFFLFRQKNQISLEKRILMFHRVETSLPFRRCSNPKCLTIHSHMMDLYNQNSDVRWSKFPWLYFKLEAHLISGMDRIFIVRRDGVEFY